MGLYQFFSNYFKQYVRHFLGVMKYWGNGLGWRLGALDWQKKAV